MSSSDIIISPDSYYSELHNDFHHLVEIDNKKYKSPTHYIYSQMMPTKSLADGLSLQLTASTVRKKATGYLFGQKVKTGRKLAEASETVILRALEEGYNAVFGRPEFRDKLLGTRNEGLIYYPNAYTYLNGDETVLGLNAADNGQNKIGDILEKLRERIQRAGNKKALRPNGIDNGVHQIDKLFFIIIRHKLLIDELKKGHFPPDYSLPALFKSLNRVSDDMFDKVFIEKYPAELRVNYWNVYTKDNFAALLPELKDEFLTGNTDWIRKAYQHFIQQRCVLIQFLKMLQIDYETLLLSLSRKQILDNYEFNKFDFDRNVKITLKEYFEKNGITRNTLIYIGEEIIQNLRLNIFEKYKNKNFDGNVLFETQLDELIKFYYSQFSHQLNTVIQKPKEGKKFSGKIFSEDVLEPLSPSKTFGGKDLNIYYSAIHPNGACGKSAEEKCPMFVPIEPSGDDYDYDDEEDVQEEEEYDMDYGDDGNGDDEFEFDINEGKEFEDYDEGGKENDEFVFAGDEEIEDRIVQNIKNAKVPEKYQEIRKYIVPVINIRFSNKDHPYGWLSPSYISNIYINGVYYPSVSHYVIAKLATPRQFRNKKIREWIQLSPSSPSELDTMQEEKYYHPISKLIEKLPDRIFQIYSQLYFRYSSRVLQIKFAQNPFKFILANTGKMNIVYVDENGQSAIAGREIVRLLTEIRSKIKFENPLADMIPNPDYNNNESLREYINERSIDLIRAVILFARYRLAPRVDYLSEALPIVSFGDAKFAIEKLYSVCKDDIDYGKFVDEPPSDFKRFFNDQLIKAVKLYLPERLQVYDLYANDAQYIIRLNQNNIESDFSDKLFIDNQGIMKFLWVHLVQVSKFLSNIQHEKLGSYKLSDNDVRQKIKMIRYDIFKEDLGSLENVVVNCVSKLLSKLHDYFPQQKKLTINEIKFLNDFIYPYNHPSYEILEDQYTSYNNLHQNIVQIFDDNEQDTEMLNSLSTIIRTIQSHEKQDDENWNKLVIRLKFFNF